MDRKILIGLGVFTTIVVIVLIVVLSKKNSQEAPKTTGFFGNLFCKAEIASLAKCNTDKTAQKTQLTKQLVDSVNAAKSERDIYWGGQNKDGSGGACVNKVLENRLKKCQGTGNNYTDIYSDISNCGACGNTCESGSCVNGICNYDYTKDNTHCGTIDNYNVCKDNQQCMDGTCFPPISDIEIIAKNMAPKWITTFTKEMASYKDNFFKPATGWIVSDLSATPNEFRLSFSRTSTIPLISGTNKNILSLELKPYEDGKSSGQCVFKIHQACADCNKSLRFKIYKPDLYNINELQNPGTGMDIDLCGISYIHFIYTDKIYVINVQNLNCLSENNMMIELQLKE